MFDIRTKIGPRLKACRAHKDWTFAETARQLGMVMGRNIVPSRYGNWELGINIPPLDMLLGLSMIFDKPAAWLGGISDNDGIAPENGGYVLPAVSTVSSSVGLQDLGDSSFAFHKSFLESHGLDPQRILLLVATDDSMQGKIEKGDRILVDLRENKVEHDDMFAIMVNERPRLRWIRQDLDGNYVIQAERRDYYPDQTVTVEKLKNLHILGRVRMIAQLR